MNKKSLCAATLFLLTASVVGSQAAIYTFKPSTLDLNDLDHYYAASWGINFTLAAGENVVDASISIDNIRNWDSNPNDLYVTLLDNPKRGINYSWDGQASGNYFGSAGLELEHYVNLSTSAQDIFYRFSTSEVTTLSRYLGTAAGTGKTNIGLGFDADCHYYNDGITFTIETTTNTVPEPATMVLFGIGMAGIGYFKKSRRA